MTLHKWLIGLSVLTMVACSPTVQKSGLEEKTALADETSFGTPIVTGRSFTLTSKIMGEEREINIWTPPNYQESDKTYSVLYVLDGGTEQDFHHISGLAQLGAMNWNYEPLIVVGVKSGVRLNELAHTATDGRYIKSEPERTGQSHIFSEYLRTEVIPYIEENYRTGPRSAIVGESLAGLFITELFLKHPDTFTDYVAISPSLWWDDRNLAKAAPALLAEHSDAKRHLYLTMANEGGTMQSGLDMVMAALKASPPKGLDWHYVDRRDSETHSTIYHGAALDALDYLFDLPEPDYGPDPWYLVEGGQPPVEEVSAKK